MARLHAMIGEQLGEDAETAEVRIGIETDRGLCVTALAAAGYTVFGMNPLQSVHPAGMELIGMVALGIEH